MANRDLGFTKDYCSLSMQREYMNHDQILPRIPPGTRLETCGKGHDLLDGRTLLLGTFSRVPRNGDSSKHASLTPHLQTSTVVSKLCLCQCQVDKVMSVLYLKDKVADVKYYTAFAWP